MHLKRELKALMTDFLNNLSSTMHLKRELKEQT